MTSALANALQRNESEGKHKVKDPSVSWYSGLTKRPSERSGDDVSLAFAHLKDVDGLRRFPPSLLQQMCLYLHYDRLDPDTIVIRCGDRGFNLFIVLSGSLAVYVTEKARLKNGPPLCSLPSGSVFGEAVLTCDPHAVSVVTLTSAEMLWLEAKDVKYLWEINREMMENAVTALSNMANLSDEMSQLLTTKEREYVSDPAAVITFDPTGKLSHAAWVLRAVLLVKQPHMIRDRKLYRRTYHRCLVGSEMVDWLLDVFPRVESREHAVGMCQVLLETGELLHVCKEHPFQDKYLFYRWAVDEAVPGPFPSEAEADTAEGDLVEVLVLLGGLSPDAGMRTILRKAGPDRTQEEVETIYEELLQIKPLSHLSYTVKRELAGRIMFEAHPRAGTVLFKQGDEGRSWYIILKGSVHVAIHGKGVVCTLGEAEDFGKLALMNDAPRAATIVLAEDNCHFLRVDKDDFNRILRDVEANTVRLKEHGKDVLVLEKIPVTLDVSSSFMSDKYSVMAGTPEKILEYLVETRLDVKDTQATTHVEDTLIEDFLLTHSVFFPDEKLCRYILNHYHSSNVGQAKVEGQGEGQFLKSQKKCVITFVHKWREVEPDKFLQSVVVGHFLDTLVKFVAHDLATQPCLTKDHDSLVALATARRNAALGKQVKKKSLFLSRKGSTKAGHSTFDGSFERKGLKPGEETIYKVHCADHTYTSVRLLQGASVREIVDTAGEKLCLGPDPVLCEVTSSGERIIFCDVDRCILPSLSVNGRLFIAPREHLDALTPLPEQEGPTSGTMTSLEVMDMKDLATIMTQYDWELYTSVPEQEVLNKVFGRSVFPEGTWANLERFLRRFSQLKHWVVTEVVLLPNLGKRVQLLRRLIKLAQHLKDHSNLQAFLAITLGLGHLAVSRLSQTWEKLPGKTKKLFSDLEALADPARHHRAYRVLVSRQPPPAIPYMALLMRDLNFTNEGNDTYYDSMVNFEKMRMMAQSIRTMRFCRQRAMNFDLPEGTKVTADMRSYVRSFQVIDNQRILTNLSHKCEPRKG